MKLNDEKVQLAKDLQRITSRAVGRLDYDLLRIRRATGDPSAFAPEPVPSIPVAPTQSFRSNPIVAAAIAATASNPSLAASIGTPAIAPYTQQAPVQIQEAPPPPPVVHATAQKRESNCK